MEKEVENLENLIYEIRGVQVMLDADLAKLYECTNGTKDINKAVNRNIERFPKDFYFQLTKEEYDNLKFQNGTSRLSSYAGVRTFCINILEDKEVCDALKNKVDKIISK